MKPHLKDRIFENFSYKIVSLLISLILWITILGRQDFTMTKVIEVDLMPGDRQVITSQSTDTVKIKVSGPRTALKKFMESGLGQTVVLDISGHKPGDLEIEVPVRQIDVPFGVKILSVRPSVIKAHLEQR